MSDRQRWVLAAGLALFLTAGLVPPWLATEKYASRVLRTTPAGHYLIFDPPRQAHSASPAPVTLDDIIREVSGGLPPSPSPSSGSLVSYGIDVQRLLILWVTIAVITAGAVLLARGARSADVSQGESASAPTLADDRPTTFRRTWRKAGLAWAACTVLLLPRYGVVDFLARREPITDKFLFAAAIDLPVAVLANAVLFGWLTARMIHWWKRTRVPRRDA